MRTYPHSLEQVIQEALKVATYSRIKRDEMRKRQQVTKKTKLM